MTGRPKRMIAGLLLASILCAGIAAFLWRQSQGSQACAALDPDRVAHLEKAGWEAYYDRNWPGVLSLMVQMNRTQFCMGWSDAIVGAVDIVRAAVAFAPVDNDIAAATAHLTQFYAKARSSAGLSTDAATLAALEIDYWIVHRQLANARKAAPDHTGDLEPMIAALEKLHAALFAAPPAAIRRSAEARALAAATVDRITGGYTADAAADWQAIELNLRDAYRAIVPAQQATVEVN